MKKLLVFLVLVACSVFCENSTRGWVPPDVVFPLFEPVNDSDPPLPVGYFLSGTRGSTSVLLQLTFDTECVRGESSGPSDRTPVQLVGQRDTSHHTFVLNDVPSLGKLANRWNLSFDVGKGVVTGEWIPTGGISQAVALHVVAERALVQIQQGSSYIARCSYLQFLKPTKAQTRLNRLEYQRAVTSCEQFMKGLPSPEDIAGSMATPWIMDSRISCTLCNPDFISFVSTTYTYTGGAHGDFDIDGRTYDLRGNVSHLLRFNQILKTDRRHWHGFETQVSKEFAEQQIHFGHFYKNTLPRQNDFSLTPSGLAIHIGQGLIAAECAGVLTAVVPYAALKGIALPSGLISKFVP